MRPKDLTARICFMESWADLSCTLHNVHIIHPAFETVASPCFPHLSPNPCWEAKKRNPSGFTICNSRP